MLLYWIWYAELPASAHGQKAALLQHFSSPEDIYHASADALHGVEGMDTAFLETLKQKDLGSAEKILEQCGVKNIRILTFQDTTFPKRLRNICDPPMVLYYKGSLPDFDNQPVVSVVGTRSASAYGLTVARRLGLEIAAGGGLVVSGCASGIDAMAMEGALSADSAVAGILGGGVDVVYPKSSRYLFDAVPKNGCLISEYPPGTRPFKWNFPKRNRLLSGIANGVLVVEAPSRSGALNTARHALEQGRDVFVVPGNIDVVSCEGSNALLREGAVAVRSGWDVLQEYAALYPGKLRNVEGIKTPTQPRLAVAQPAVLPKGIQKPEAEKDRKGIDNREKSHYSVINDPSPQLTEEELAIVKHLRTEPRPVDEIIAETELPAAGVLSTLTRLTLKGIVRNHPGKRVSLNKPKEPLSNSTSADGSSFPPAMQF